MIKSYTSLEQSKHLAEFLPIESADMRYAPFGDTHPWFWDGHLLEKGAIPCWSLSALLSVLPNYQLQTQDDGTGILCSCKGKFNIITADTPVDACYEMIVKLHEQKML